MHSGKPAGTFSSGSAGSVRSGRRSESWDCCWEVTSREEREESGVGAALPTGSSALKRSGDGWKWVESGRGSETLLRKPAGGSAREPCSGGRKVTEGSAVWLWVTSANS